jgi:S1-C subfamily serine protease/uncharacterized membrane protein YfcA
MHVTAQTRFRTILGALALTVTIASACLSAKATAAPDALAHLEAEVRITVARVKPAVVSISAERVRNTGRTEEDGALLYRSIGSGVIVDPRGVILTNAHVVEGARSIQVRMWHAPPITYQARILHLDKGLDLAVIQIVGSGPFQAAKLVEHSRPARVGDWVVAIGSPFGLNHSVSMGIVSDRARRLWIGDHLYEDLLQTDAAINQGNSGGPLVNLDGKVVGINTAIYAPHGVFSGVGFAIPADRARAYLESVVQPAVPGLAATQVRMRTIQPNARSPHPARGACENCHTIRGSVRTAALVSPLPSGKQSASDAWQVVKVAAALVLAAAALFNMLGLGGGFFYVPMLLQFGVNFQVASATSLFIMTAAHTSALFVFLRSRLIDYKLALVLEPITCLGAFLGGLSSGLFGEAQLSVMFGSILVLASYLMSRRTSSGGVLPLKLSPRLCWNRTFGIYEYSIDLSIGLPVAFIIGFFGGMLGFAGGIIKIPMLVLLFAVPIKVAIATSSVMVALTSLVGCIGHGMAGHFDPRLAVVLAVAAVIGAQIGSRLTLRADRFQLKRIFAIVLLLVAVWMFIRVI